MKATASLLVSTALLAVAITSLADIPPYPHPRRWGGERVSVETRKREDEERQRQIQEQRHKEEALRLERSKLVVQQVEERIGNAIETLMRANADSIAILDGLVQSETLDCNDAWQFIVALHLWQLQELQRTMPNGTLGGGFSVPKKDQPKLAKALRENLPAELAKCFVRLRRETLLNRQKAGVITAEELEELATLQPEISGSEPSSDDSGAHESAEHGAERDNQGQINEQQ